MNEEQSAGELMVLALIDQADRLGKSVWATQQELGKQIEKLVAMEARIHAAVAAIHAEVKHLAEERARLHSIGPLLQQSASRAMRESIQEHSDKFETQISAGMDEPLSQIRQAADHVRQIFKETKWLAIISYILLGAVLAFALGYLSLRSDVNALRDQGDRIEQSLAAQQQKSAQPPTTPKPDHAPKRTGKAN